MNQQTGAIFIDIIECLLSLNANVSKEYYDGIHYISECVKKANIRRFPPIVLCSARNRNYISIIAFLIGLPNNWSIVEHGTIFWNPAMKQMTLHPNLNPKAIKDFRKAVNPIIRRILKEYPGLFLSPGNEVCFSIEREYGIDCVSLEQVHKKVRRALARTYRKKHTARVTTSKHSVDIVPYGINRRSAVEVLSLISNIDLRKSLGIGSSKEDILFLRKLGLIGCPSNASEACRSFIRERRGRVSRLSCAGGVADIIKYYFQQETQKG